MVHQLIVTSWPRLGSSSLPQCLLKFLGVRDECVALQELRKEIVPICQDSFGSAVVAAALPGPSKLREASVLGSGLCRVQVPAL